MTNGVAPSSGNGDSAKLSPGSSTGQTGMDMPKTPEHKQANGDMTNGVAPSSGDGSDVKLSPGSATGQTGMDMPKTPEHKQWNGDMSMSGVTRHSDMPRWVPLMRETTIDAYATVIIQFDHSLLS